MLITIIVPPSQPKSNWSARRNRPIELATTGSTHESRPANYPIPQYAFSPHYTHSRFQFNMPNTPPFYRTPLHPRHASTRSLAFTFPHSAVRLTSTRHPRQRVRHLLSTPSSLYPFNMHYPFSEIHSPTFRIHTCQHLTIIASPSFPISRPFIPTSWPNMRRHHRDGRSNGHRRHLPREIVHRTLAISTQIGYPD